MPPAKESARPSWWKRATASIRGSLAHFREPLYCLEQLLRLRLRVRTIARCERACDAVVHVAVEDLEGERVERGRDRADLGEDVDAVAIFVNHPLDAAHLAL